MRRYRSLTNFVLYLSVPLFFIFLMVARPPIPFYALPLAPIALAAMLHGFAGGMLLALAAMAGVYEAERWEAKELVKRHIFAMRQ